MLKKTDIKGYYKSKDPQGSWESKPILYSFLKNKTDEIKEWESSGVLSKALNKKNEEVASNLVKAVLLSLKNGHMSVTQAAEIFDTFKSLMVSSYRFQYRHRSYTLDRILEGDTGYADWLETVRMIVQHPLFFKNSGASEFQYSLNFSTAELFQVTVRKMRKENDPEKVRDYFQFLNEDVFSALTPRDAVMSTFVMLADDKDHELFDQMYLYLVEKFTNPQVKIRYPLPLSYFPRSSFASHYYEEMTPEAKEKIKHVCLIAIQSEVFFETRNEDWSNCNWLFESQNAFSVTSDWGLWKNILSRIKVRASSEILSHGYSLGCVFMKSAFGKINETLEPGVVERLQKQKEENIKGLKNFFEFYQGKSAEEVLSLVLELQSSWKNAFHSALPLQVEPMFTQEMAENFWKPLLALASPFVEDEHETAQKIVEQTWVLVQQMIPEMMRGIHNSATPFQPESLLEFIKEAGFDVVQCLEKKKLRFDLLGGIFMLQSLPDQHRSNAEDVDLSRTRIRYPFKCWLNNLGNPQKYDAERNIKSEWEGFLMPVCEFLMRGHDAHEVRELVGVLMEKKALQSAEKLLKSHRLTLREQEQYSLIKKWLHNEEHKEGAPLEVYGIFKKDLNVDLERVLDVLSYDFDVPGNTPQRFNKLLSDVLGLYCDPKTAQEEHLHFIERQYQRKSAVFNCEQRKNMIEQLGLHYWHQGFRKIYESEMLEYLNDKISKKNILASAPSKIERF